MNVLLDECLPRKLKTRIVGYKCETVPEAGFAGMKNGELLATAEHKGFEIFITLDRGIRFQQRLGDRKLAIILLRAKSSRLADLIPLLEEVLSAISTAKPGDLIHWMNHRLQ
jgi:predicted nuclease of predicted toxin-antitoxin system